MLWSLLILSLPQQRSTARMRAWRSLKTAGAAVLRDGVYLLPASDPARTLLSSVAADVRSEGGEAHLFDTEAPEDDHAGRFDRTADWAALLTDISALRQGLGRSDPAESQRQLRRWRRQADTLCAVDFFSGESQRQTLEALDALALALARLLSPHEPVESPPQEPPRRLLSEHQARVWATRARPKVDRLASAWLIRRFIDPQARFLWLAHPGDCPPEALGFDFDGATFSHQGGRVTFETLLASFGLESPALQRLGQLVHGLDVGGVQAPEAPGVAQVLAGMHEALDDDDQLLWHAAGVFEALWIRFEKESHE